MNIMLIGRDSATTLIDFLAEDENLWVSVNANDLLDGMVYWRCYYKYIDIVLIIEENTNLFDTNYIDESLANIRKIAKNKEGKKIIYITSKEQNFNLLKKENLPNVEIYTISDKKLFLSKALDTIRKKIMWNENFKNNNINKIEDIIKHAKEYPKTIVFTGQDGAGITATAAHMAYHASIIGIKTYVINLDFSDNVFHKYFYKEGSTVNSIQSCDDYVNSFLNPSNFEEFAKKINDKLYLSTYFDADSLNSDKLLKISDKNILQNSILEFRKNAQLIILDIPFMEQSIINSITNQVDAIALCVANNLYSLNSFTKMLKNIKSEQEFFEKTKLVISKFHMKNTYGGKAFNVELACDILAQMNKEMDIKFAPGGIIFAIEDFIADVENKDNQSIKNNELKKRYLETLYEIISV
jgi:cellulose biosynthesis protein BcsQ